MSLRKITAEQEHQLIQIFLHMGQQVVAPMCVEAGVSDSYARSRAYEFGLVPRKQRGSAHLTHKAVRVDPRWGWAIERGSIVA